MKEKITVGSGHKNTLIDMASAGFPYIRFTANDDKIYQMELRKDGVYFLTKDNGTWTTRYGLRGFVPGDIARYTLYTTGYLTGNKQNIQFTLPVSSYSTYNISSGKITGGQINVRQNGVYLWGTSDSLVDILNNFTVGTVFCGQAGISLSITAKNASSQNSTATNNSPVGLWIKDLTFEFS